MKNAKFVRVVGLFLLIVGVAQAGTGQPPGFSKAFEPSTIEPSGVSTLTFTIDNTGNPETANDASFADTFPAGMTVANPPGTATTCGGLVDAFGGGTTVSFFGGTVPGSGQCTVQVDVTAGDVGEYPNVSGDLESSLGNSGNATATLVVEIPPPPTPPTFMKEFAPSTVGEIGISTLTFTLDNSASDQDATDAAFTDSLPDDLYISAEPGVPGCDGSLNAPALGGVISFVSGTIPAGTSCTVEVDVFSFFPGIYDNVSGDLTTSLGNSGTASASLCVNAVPGMVWGIVPSDPVPGEEFRGYMTVINNPDVGPCTVDELAFDIDFTPFATVEPSAELLGAANTCGGTLVATPGSSYVSLSGGSVGPGSTCEIQVPLRAVAEGEHPIVTTLSTSVGSGPPNQVIGTLSVGPATGVTDIPTMSQWGLLGLGGVLLASALAVLRRRG